MSFSPRLRDARALTTVEDVVQPGGRWPAPLPATVRDWKNPRSVAQRLLVVRHTGGIRGSDGPGRMCAVRRDEEPSMLLNACSLAQRKLLQAFYHNGTLAIFATGTVPTACHEVTIKRVIATVEPLQFSVLQYRRAGICSQSVTPYTVSQLFAIGVYRPVVVVAHASGQDELAVEHVGEYHPHGQMNPVGGEVPVPYVFPPSTARNSSVHDTATGYSTAFDFGEALREAVAALAPNPHLYPDQLTTVTIVEVGVELGGIAGFHHLFVRVRREPDPLTSKRA